MAGTITGLDPEIFVSGGQAQMFWQFLLFIFLPLPYFYKGGGGMGPFAYSY